MTRNLLSEETSPYLLQHRKNPVHWRAWNADSLAEAKRENRPILLSIGYAACHWCHVMAHESFENEDIAGLMNELFISIKVDREERPDIDAIYQSALSMMGDHGGWPLTMFLTPDAEPFWGGTYFPATASYGRPAFPDLLKSISRTFHDENAKVMENAAVLKEGLARLAKPEGGGEPTPDKLDQMATMILHAVDPIKGGTQGAPKFPQPSLFRFLWHAHRRLGGRAGSPMFRDAVTLTLDNICQGGIYDHLGGGFARYSTDEDWLAPHFEKMLYDNAQLINLMTDVWLETQNPLYAQRIQETVEWLMREMQSADKGPFAFTSALDADSEGEEGRFYVWSEDEIDEILGPEAPFFKEAYDVTPGGNWEGKVILNRSHDLRLGDGETEARLLEAREKLLAVRGGRIRPERDDKVLADWNGLMITALARAGMVFERPPWIDAAKAAFGFVLESMTETGSAGERLRHSWCSGRLQHPAVLDDYANMALAALTLHGVTGDPEYLAQAERWTGTADAHYWDEDGGGYFLSADDTGDVIARSKSVLDNAVPSGNGVMAQVLARLYYLTGDSAYRDRAEALIRAIAGKEPGNMVHQPTLLGAFEILETCVQAVIIAGEGDPAEAVFRHAVYAAGLTNLIVNRLRPGQDLSPGHPAHGKEQVDGKATVYVCRGPVCGLPLTDIDALREELARL